MNAPNFANQRHESSLFESAVADFKACKRTNAAFLSETTCVAVWHIDVLR
ncbi:hypothetical protein RD1_2583 [Roseobacter denitrificans OCh 114]|uniref:Uncharacterized protein n=1 Tax=Roseobacter denitrificans (strain ATCC 33942 / OCh 114) TaxID=375451 RepID=Q166F8_ROSDO|nr:hypothetical protein RD1_2583 [Roseobacter denitrificans OCh 114]